MSTLNVVDRIAFAVSIAAGTAGAIAGAYGWNTVAMIAGCTTVVASIVNRKANNSLTAPLVERSLTEKQKAILIAHVKTGGPFSLWVNHNREEAEASAIHAQIVETLTQAGLDAKSFGGLNNKTIGIEIGGPNSPEKQRLLKGFSAAKIRVLNVEYSDGAKSEDTPLNSVGIVINIGQRF